MVRRRALDECRTETFPARWSVVGRAPGSGVPRRLIPAFTGGPGIMPDRTHEHGEARVAGEGRRVVAGREEVVTHSESGEIVRTVRQAAAGQFRLGSPSVLRTSPFVGTRHRYEKRSVWLKKAYLVDSAAIRTR